MIGHDFQMRVREMALAGNSLPIILFHSAIVVVAVSAGKQVGDAATSGRRSAPTLLHKGFSPAFNLHCDILGRWRTDRPPLRKRMANIENVCNIGIEQRRTLF